MDRGSDQDATDGPLSADEGPRGHVLGVRDAQRPGERAFSTTCDISAGKAHIAYAGVRMDEVMQACYRRDDLATRCVGQRLDEVMQPSGTSEYITEAEAIEAGERWQPTMLRITRTYELRAGAPPPESVRIHAPRW